MQRPQPIKTGHKPTTNTKNSKKQTIIKCSLQQKFIKKSPSTTTTNNVKIKSVASPQKTNTLTNQQQKNIKIQKRDKAEMNHPSRQISMVMESYYNFNIKKNGLNKDDQYIEQSAIEESAINSQQISQDISQNTEQFNCKYQQKNSEQSNINKKTINNAIIKKQMALGKIMSNKFYQFDGEDQHIDENRNKSSKNGRNKLSRNTSNYKNDKSHSKKPRKQQKKTVKKSKEHNKKINKNQKILQSLEKDNKKQKNGFVDQIQRNAAKQIKYQQIKRKTRVNSKNHQLLQHHEINSSQKKITFIQNKIQQELIAKNKNHHNKSNTSLSINSRNSSKHYQSKKKKNNTKSHKSNKKLKSKDIQFHSLKNSVSYGNKNGENFKSVDVSQITHSRLINDECINSTPKKNMLNSQQKFTKIHVKAVYFDLLSRICGQLLLTREIFDLAQFYFVRNIGISNNSPNNRHQITNTSLYDLTDSYVQNIEIYPTVLLSSLILAIKMDDSGLAKPFFRELTNYNNHHTNMNKNHSSYYHSLSTTNLSCNNSGLKKYENQSKSSDKKIKSSLNTSQLYHQEDSVQNCIPMASFLPLNIPPPKDNNGSGQLKKQQFINRIPLFKKRIPHRSLPYLKKLKQIISQWMKSDPSAYIDIPGKQELLKKQRQICENMQYRLVYRTISHYVDLLTFLWDDFIRMLISVNIDDKVTNQKFKKSLNKIKKLKNLSKYLFFRKIQDTTKISYLIYLVNYYKFNEQNYDKNQQHHDLLFILTTLYLLLRAQFTVVQQQPDIFQNSIQKAQQLLKQELTNLKHELSQSTNAIYSDDTGINILFTQFLDLDYAGCNIKMQMIVNYCEKVTKFMQVSFLKTYDYKNNGNIGAQQTMINEYGSWAIKSKYEKNTSEQKSRINSIIEQGDIKQQQRKNEKKLTDELQHKKHQQVLRYHFYNSEIYKYIIKQNINQKLI